MDMEGSLEKDHLIDIENGEISMIDKVEDARQLTSSNGQGKKILNRVWSGFIGIDGLVKGEGTLKCAHSNSNYSEIAITDVEISAEKIFEDKEGGSILEKKVDPEKTKKKSCKKPPRPPRTSKSPSLYAADKKLMRELSELAMLKKARIERMKKKLKSTKTTASSSNLCALVITIIFCLVMLWQGFFSRGSSSVSFHGSPESSVRTRSGLITIQFNKNASRYAPQIASTASPKMEPVSGMNDHAEARKLG